MLVQLELPCNSQRPSILSPAIAVRNLEVCAHLNRYQIALKPLTQYALDCIIFFKKVSQSVPCVL